MPTESTPLVGSAEPMPAGTAEEDKAAQTMQNMFKRKQVKQAKKNHAIARLGLNNRMHWVIVTCVVLFIAKGAMPFVNDAIHATQTGLVDDPALNITESTIGELSAASDLTEGLAKLTVAPALWLLGPRNALLAVLGMGSINVLLPAFTESMLAMYNLAITQYIFAAWAGPATTMTVAGWVDGHQLGKALGIIAVATKATPSIMFTVYGLLMVEGVDDSWTSCFKLAGAIFAVVFIVVFLFLRSSAKSIGFREPTPPGAPAGANTSKLRHPLAQASGFEAFIAFISMPRTWALMASFSLLVILKGGSKFASIYAKHRLHATHQQGSTLQTTYAVASIFSGLAGGYVYDVVPGGKKGIGTLMTSLNLLNLCGFIFAFLCEVTGNVSMLSLYIFMGTIGFASVLPVSLVFQVYAMAIGGVKHCGSFIAAIEFVAHFAEAALDLVVGQLLEDENFSMWLLINCCIAIAGTFFMALFYYLDYIRAPDAKTLTAAPDLNTKSRRSIGRAMMFAAGQAQTEEGAKQASAARAAALLGGGGSRKSMSAV